MNERGDGRRAFHRVGQPYVQRELTRFSNRPDEEEEARDGQEYRAERQDLKRHEHAQVQKVERAEMNLQEQDAEEQAEVANARRDERLLRGLPRRYALIVETDQKVRAKSDALPEDVELQEVRREHEAEHRRDEERDEREEASHAGIVLHVADRVNRDAKRYRRDDEEHHRRDGIDEDAHLQDKTADRHPDGLRDVRRFYRDRRGENLGDDAAREREARGDCGDDERRRKAPQSTQKAREDEGDSRQKRYEPRMVQGKRGKHRATS